MSINNVTQSPNFNQQSYDNLVQTSSSKGITQTALDKNLLAALNNGIPFDTAVNNELKGLPNLPQANGNIPAEQIKEWVPISSPGALVMSLMVDNASQDRKTNRDTMQVQAQQIVQKMEEEADNLRSTAVSQLVCGIIGGTLQIAGGIAGGLIAGGVGPVGKGADILVSAKSQAFNTAFGGASSIANSTGQYLGSIGEADRKEMQVTQEKLRMDRDVLKSFNDSLQELINKTISSMDAIQGNMNQTRTRILG